MSTRTMVLLASVVLVLALTEGVWATADDMPGSEDHPLISRFAGSFIYAKEYRVFDAYVVPTGRILEESQSEEMALPDMAAPSSGRVMYRPETGILVEGEVTKLTYVVPKEHSVLEVYRSYQQTLEEAGFDTLFSASGDHNIGPYAAWHIARYGVGPEHRGHQMREPVEDRLLTARLDHSEGGVYVVLYTLYSSGGREYPEQVRVQLDMVEEGTLEKGLTSADPEYERVDPDIQPIDAEDYEEGIDHPLVSRFAGSFMYAQEHRTFDAYVVPTGRILEKSQPQEGPLPDMAAPGSRGDMYKPKTGVLAEGEITKFTYVVPKEHSVLEVYRSYQQALEKAGFDILFSGSGDHNIGPYAAWHIARYGVGPKHRGYLMREPVEDRLLTARLDHPEGSLYVVLYTLYSSGGREYPEHVRIQLDIVEEGAMEDELVRIDMEQSLAMYGAVAIQDIHFDFDSAQLLPESDQTLAEIADLLAAHDALKLYIVGHTDDVGCMDYNIDLSRRRADAVVEALASDYNISSDRLTAFGVGPTAPIASNATEEGQALNRRVELVQRTERSETANP